MKDTSSNNSSQFSNQVPPYPPFTPSTPYTPQPSTNVSLTSPAPFPEWNDLMEKKKQLVNGFLAGDTSRTKDEIKNLIAQADSFYSALENRLSNYP